MIVVIVAIRIVRTITIMIRIVIATNANNNNSDNKDLSHIRCSDKHREPGRSAVTRRFACPSAALQAANQNDVCAAAGMRLGHWDFWLFATAGSEKRWKAEGLLED